MTQIDIDDDALERAMALSKVRPKKEAVNLALHFYAERQEPAARIGRHFERAREWGAVEDAERPHRAEKCPVFERVAERKVLQGWWRKKPQVVDLGFHHGAGDEDRTRALSLGSDGA